MNEKRIISGYAAIFGKEIGPNTILSEKCEITIPDSFNIKDSGGNVIGKGSAKIDKKGIKVKGVLK